MKWWKFYWCAGTDINTCPGRMLKVQYDEMIEANCRNCDKFFHCQGNYNAAIGCGKTDNNKRIAKKCES
jgi:serum amyloid A protein